MKTENNNLELWLAADSNGYVYCYTEKPTYDKDDRQYHGSGMNRVEAFDGAIEARTYEHFILDSSETEEFKIHEEAKELLEYFLSAGKISVDYAFENASKIVDTCYALSKELYTHKNK